MQKALNWSAERFVIKNVKNTVSWTCVILDLNREGTAGTFYKKEFEFKFAKVIKRKSNKIYVKWKDYDSSYNSWIDKKGIA